MRNSTQTHTSGAFSHLTRLAPSATRKQLPIDGAKSVRSATTNPTRNRIFVAGKNGTKIATNAPVSSTFLAFLRQLTHLQARAAVSSPRARLAAFLASHSVSTSGMQPSDQSKQSQKGRARRYALRVQMYK